MGGMLLAAASTRQTPSLQPDPVVAKLLPAAATSRRSSRGRHARALHRDLRQHLGRQARRIDVAVRLLSENGTEVFSSHDELANARDGRPKSPGKSTAIPKQIPVEGRRTRSLPASRRSPGARQCRRCEAALAGNRDHNRTVITEGDWETRRGGGKKILLLSRARSPNLQKEVSMRRWVILLAFLTLVPSSALMQEKGGEDEFGPTKSCPTGRSRFPARKATHGDRPAASSPKRQIASGSSSAA